MLERIRVVSYSCLLVNLVNTVNTEFSLEDPLIIEGSGLFPVVPNSLGLFFYVAVFNRGCYEVDTAVKMIECNEVFSNCEADTSSMELVGGYMGLVQPGSRRNLTLLFHNMFPYNRRGECSVAVWYRDLRGSIKEQITRIPFETILAKEYVPPLLKGYYWLSQYTTCPYHDQDTLSNCQPVDCSRKYNGRKVFYSNRLNRCVPAVVCPTNLSKTSPDVAYMPDVNICVNLDHPLGASDVKFFSDGFSSIGTLPEAVIGRFQICHHGSLNRATGECVCDSGWASVPGTIRPTTLPVHMCTISLRSYGNFDKPSSLFDDDNYDDYADLPPSSCTQEEEVVTETTTVVHTTTSEAVHVSNNEFSERVVDVINRSIPLFHPLGMISIFILILSYAFCKFYVLPDCPSGEYFTETVKIQEEKKKEEVKESIETEKQVHEENEFIAPPVKENQPKIRRDSPIYKEDGDDDNLKVAEPVLPDNSMEFRDVRENKAKPGSQANQPATDKRVTFKSDIANQRSNKEVTAPVWSIFHNHPIWSQIRRESAQAKNDDTISTAVLTSSSLPTDYSTLEESTFSDSS